MALQLALGVVRSADHNVYVALEKLLHPKIVGGVVEGKFGCTGAQRPRGAGIDEPGR